MTRFLWGLLNMLFSPQDHEWLHAMEAEYVYLLDKRKKLKFLFQCILGALNIRLRRTCTSPSARLSLVVIVAVLSIAMGCLVLNAIFPNSLANWFIACNPHLSPLGKLLFWQYAVLLATLSASTLIGFSAWANDYRNVTFLSLLSAGILIASIIITQNLAVSDPTIQAAGISVFYWQLFSLTGVFSFNRFLQSKLRQL